MRTAPPLPRFSTSASTRSLSVPSFLAYSSATSTVRSRLPSLTTITSYVKSFSALALVSKYSRHSSSMMGSLFSSSKAGTITLSWSVGSSSRDGKRRFSPVVGSR
uniref:Putative secreted protein n=1 Tax=Anopheles triannulatus TaxID=58253 RepID=A0A2M4B0Q5_9DIPT